MTRGSARGRWEALRRELLAIDEGVYRAIAGTPTPVMDRFWRPLTSSADNSMLWLVTAAIMAASGGEPARRAAIDGVASIAVASTIVNQGFKHLSRRPRPDRIGVPVTRHVPMPASTSFPSGHSASAFAFAEGVSATQPSLGAVLRVAAGAVAYTRVHAGVHYPGDIVAGALIGVACGRLGPVVVQRAAGSRLLGKLRAPAEGQS